MKALCGNAPTPTKRRNDECFDESEESNFTVPVHKHRFIISMEYINRLQRQHNKYRIEIKHTLSYEEIIMCAKITTKIHSQRKGKFASRAAEAPHATLGYEHRSRSSYSHL